MHYQEIDDFAVKLGPTRTAIAERVANVTFGISAISENGERQKLPGSGVFIAPYLALTAKHVLAEVISLTDRQPTNGELLRVAFRLHQVSTFDSQLFATTPMATWDVVEAIECPFSDLALLSVLPANTAAEELAASGWRNSMFRLRLLPPTEDARVHAFGFPGREWEFDASAKQLNVTSGITMSEGRVTEVFYDWRLEPRPSRPVIFGPAPTRGEGLTDFSCFEMTAHADKGMSGGPVFYGSDLLGIVSTGLEFEKDDREDATRSRAAALWPLIFTKNIPTGLERVPFLSLLRSALMNCADWRDAERDAYLEDVHGRMRARLRR